MNKELRDFRTRTGVHISTSMTGKMRGIWSLSTSVSENPICRERAKIKGSICEKCFASRAVGCYKGLRLRLAENTRKLARDVIPASEWPDVSEKEIFRLESFGDIQSKEQALNYLHFAKRNPSVTFAWWTKNPQFIADALENYCKPENLIIIQSSAFVNKPETKKYDFIDKVFTVYTKEYAKENNIKITCGARSCDTCRRCYKKRTADTVAELLK